MKPFYRFTASAGSTTLHIFDEIGLWGVQAADFRAQLDKVTTDTILVEINSPGGDVFVAVAIYNMLKASGKKVVTKVMGIAASAASLIMMAGDEREMPEGAFVMVHDASSGAYGKPEDLRKAADLLDKIGAEMSAIYARRTGLTTKKVAELLAAETWMTAHEAVRLGFATKVGDSIDAHATFNLARAALPAHVAASFQPRNATRRPRGVSLADEITSLCNVARQPQFAAGFIAAGKTLAQVRMALLSADAAAQPGATTTSLWNNHNKQGKK